MPLPDHLVDDHVSTPAAWTAPRTASAARRRVAELLAGGRARPGGAAAVLLPTLVLGGLLAAGPIGPSAPVSVPAGDPGVATYPVGSDHVDVAAGAAVRAEEPPAAPVRFASYEDLELVLPSQRALISGFHEASFRDALRLRPWGTPLASDNPRKDAVAPISDGPNYAIMSTRGRPTHATSAVDVAVPRHAPIASPVSGTVVSVTPYRLYDRYADTRIEIRPATRPDLVVTVLHVSGASVQPGDEVVGGRTTIASSATAFPFRSHVDAYAGGRPPHVHIELKRVG